MDLEASVDSEWMFDLVSPYRRRRDAAVARHVETITAIEDAIRVQHAVWVVEKTWRPKDPNLAASMGKAQTAQLAAYAKTVHGVVGKFQEVRWAGDLDDYRRLAPYAVLFLQWEAQFPEQWRSAGPWSPWGLKKRVLRQFADMHVPQPQVDAMTWLTLAAINRDQRCEDLGYVLVARGLDGPALRAGIDAAACSPNSTVQLRASYMRWAMDHPESPVTLASWRAYRSRSPSGEYTA